MKISIVQTDQKYEISASWYEGRVVKLKIREPDGHQAYALLSTEEVCELIEALQQNFR